ncbi:hypothetical protein I550_4932 [Mycobacterium intracellulare 1956]|uniref:DUF7937 domain-containing protein n=1 Tax=Mycobacterium intracellulare 1956 TaxID=1299331 RepID=X8CBZ3_MYCIT|nr:hypothetical protein I550_4932 [Mycobacterium intracellulare 1956]
MNPGGHGEPEQRRHANRPHRARAQQAPAPRIIRPHATGGTTPVAGGTGRRRAIVSDATAVVLLVLAVFLPWNLYFGVGIPDSSPALFAVLLAVTVLAVAAVAVAGSWRSGGERFNPASAARLRLALNAPYLLLVLAVVAFDAYETVRFGGTVTVPGGVGPGRGSASPARCSAPRRRRPGRSRPTTSTRAGIAPPG